MLEFFTRSSGNTSPTPSARDTNTVAAAVSPFGACCKSGHCSEQGKRPTMEDKYVSFDEFNTFVPKSVPKDMFRAFYGVYDGHGGIAAANMCADILHTNIVKESAFGKGRIEEAITKGFKATDKKIIEKATKDGWTDGCTAVCVMIFGNTLYVGNLGDAEAVLASKKDNGKVSVKCVSFKHKPADPAEKQRVEQAGGRIFLGRVMGTLAVSRAFGDAEFKMPQNKAKQDFVSSDPYIGKVALTTDHHFLIVACDGVWEKVDYQDAANCVDAVKATGKDAAQAAAALVKLALDRGTMDNVTCVVVYLDWNSKKKP